jgi:AcrR family transcriptional regulator
VTRRDGEDRRQAVLEAARALFATEGVAATGIEAIRRAAGASPSSMYHLFGGLAAIRLAVLEQIFIDLFAHLAARVARASDAEGAIVAMVEGHLDWVFSREGEARAMYELTSLPFPPDLLDVFVPRKEAAMAPLMAALSPHLASGALPPWPVAFADVVLMGPTHEACRRLLLGAPFDRRMLRRTLPPIAWSTVVAAKSAGGARRGAGGLGCSEEPRDRGVGVSRGRGGGGVAGGNERGSAPAPRGGGGGAPLGSLHSPDPLCALLETCKSGHTLHGGRVFTCESDCVRARRCTNVHPGRQRGPQGSAGSQRCTRVCKGRPIGPHGSAGSLEHLCIGGGHSAGHS